MGQFAVWLSGCLAVWAAPARLPLDQCRYRSPPSPHPSVVAVRAGEAHAIRWLPSREEAGAPSRGAFLLEVVSSVPVLMGAAFTQNNIHGAVSPPLAGLKGVCGAGCCPAVLAWTSTATPTLPRLLAPQMHQLRPYRQGLLDAAQALARALTVAVFLAIGLSNYAIFGPDLQASGAGRRRRLLGSGGWLAVGRSAARPAPLPPSRLPLSSLSQLCSLTARRPAQLQRRGPEARAGRAPARGAGALGRRQVCIPCERPRWPAHVSVASAAQRVVGAAAPVARAAHGRAPLVCVDQHRQPGG